MMAIGSIASDWKHQIGNDKNDFLGVDRKGDNGSMLDSVVSTIKS